jgi:diphthamide biosynthesis protein 2
VLGSCGVSGGELGGLEGASSLVFLLSSSILSPLRPFDLLLRQPVLQDFLRPIITPYELGLALLPEPEWTGRYVLDFETILAEAQIEKASSTTNGSNGTKSSHAGHGGQEDDLESEGGEDDDRPQFSLVTGKYRTTKRYGGTSFLVDISNFAAFDASAYPAPYKEKSTEPNESSTDVILRNQDSALAMVDSAAGAFFLFDCRSSIEPNLRCPTGEFLLQRSWQGLERRLGEDAPSLLEQGRIGIARGYGDDHQPE